MSLILASNSQIRRQMLSQAGVEVEVRSPDFDEEEAKRSIADGAQDLALRMAIGKAGSIATGADDWVIGSDSTVMVDGVAYSKPGDRGRAADHLRAFSGRTMLLSSAVALARQGRVEWSHAETARLEVRALSESFIDEYLDAEWPDVGYCVGVFRMEGRGVTLFDRVEGSHFTVLGMPLIPLLGALRRLELMPS
jgi:septum formation protein